MTLNTMDVFSLRELVVDEYKKSPTSFTSIHPEDIWRQVHARDDVDYILDTFPIVRKNDEKAHGGYRTGKPYQTRLDPPPADPRVAHPDTRGSKQ